MSPQEIELAKYAISSAWWFGVAWLLLKAVVAVLTAMIADKISR